VSKKLIYFYVRSIAVYGAETWALRKVDQKYLETFEMWYWRTMDKNSWTDCMRNEEVLETGEEYLTYDNKKEN